MANDTVGMVAKVLVLVGGLNWGLVAIGGFLGTNLNVVNLLLGGLGPVENVVYLLVGLSAAWGAVQMSKGN